MPNKFRELPLYFLLITFLLIGLFTFKDYGLSWDEPLYYDYGKGSQYAYSIPAHLDGTFELEKSYGKSASDHVTRGPAYLLIGGLLEGLLEQFDLDMASAWHLTNFLTYLVGLTFFYILTRIWLDPWPAALSTAFFATQPIFWNHAFINPKDIPFTVFFLISMVLGFRMIDQWEDGPKIWQTILPGIFLGITASIRFIGPYAVILLFLYFLTKRNWKSIWLFVPYGLISILTMVALWPYLWPNPVERFISVLQAMADIPANLKILFMGNEYRAYELPRRYYPALLAATLTEPTWFLFFIGVVTAFYNSIKHKVDRAKLAAILLWFGIFIALLIGLNPPNSDAYRHYLFILPPVFIFAGLGIHEIIKRINSQWIKYIVAFLILLPAMYNNIALHPYQYAYFNTFYGGTKSAFREYETEYWLTCYKEAMEAFNDVAPQNTVIFIKREPYIAAYYARPDIIVYDYRTDLNNAQSGDYVLINSRTNDDIKTLKDAPIFLRVGRAGADFCVVKQIP